MERSNRDLYVEAIDCLLRDRIPSVINKRDWVLLEKISEIAQNDARIDMAMTDPSMFIAIRNAVTRYHLGGWSNMTPDRVREVASQYSARADDISDQKSKSEKSSLL